jgi:hypothetical protein
VARPAGDLTPRADGAGVPARAVATALIGLSAFLLFAVQPLVGRLVLPAFGGAPAAWATVLVFFQTVVLAGYAYAHLSATRLGPRRGLPVHLMVLAVGMVLTVVTPSRFSEARIETLPPALDVLRLLATTVGPAAVALAATTPLVSAWLVRAGQGSGSAGRDPYRLYAISNAGSLAALAAYPILVDPLGLAAQRWLFLGGLVGVAILFVATGRSLQGARPGETEPGDPTAAGAGPAAGGAPIVRSTVARWVLLAAVPAGLMAAVTNFVANDLVSAPLLWIGPLGTYLVTLIVAFSRHGPAVSTRLARLVPIVVAILVVPYAAPVDWPILPLLAVEYGGLAILGLVLHGGLAADRPPPEALTRFYLAIAAGGAIGGAFVALLAPVAFDDVWEYPILLLAACAAMVVSPRLRAAAATPFTRRRPPSRILDLAPALAGATRRLTIYLAVAGLLGVLLTLSRSVAVGEASTWLLIGAAMVLFGGEIRVFTLVATAVLVGALLLPPPSLFIDRSFFGVVEVERTAPTADEPALTVLRHGTTVHGVQSTDPTAAREPTGYFSRSGPFGDIMARLGERLGSLPRRSVVVGLGAGTIAAYARPGDVARFVEIDELVERVATDRGLFSYLGDAASGLQVVIDDGRLAIEAEPDGAWDLVVLDAFSSDVLPVHLITAEALAEDVRVLAPGGLLAVNVSSRHYDLAPPIATALGSAGRTTLRRVHEPTAQERARGVTTSEWVVATDAPDDVAWFEARGWSRVLLAAEPLTDDRSDVLRFVRLDALW